MAPAELEGHLLDHPDVSDVCVVGVPDDYSGELPLAFVVPSLAALERIQKDPAEADKIRAALAKVSLLTFRAPRLGVLPSSPTAPFCAVLTSAHAARRGREGALQAPRGRRRVPRRDSEESEREAAPQGSARAGEGAQGAGEAAVDGESETVMHSGAQCRFVRVCMRDTNIPVKDWSCGWEPP